MIPIINENLLKIKAIEKHIMTSPESVETDIFTLGMSQKVVKESIEPRKYRYIEYMDRMDKKKNTEDCDLE